MAAKNSDTTPYWSTSATFPQFAKLAEDVVTDVVVVGAGMTGLSAAYLLAKAGKQVIVLERGRCAGTDTGHTSAHLTMVTDTRLRELVKKFGRNHAQAVWDAGLAAIAKIDEVIREHAIDAGFEWVDGYLHAPLNDDAGDQATSAGGGSRRSRATSASTRNTSRRRHWSTGPVSVSPTRLAFTRAPTWRAWRRRSWRSAAGSTSTRRPTEFCDEPRAVKVNGRTVSCEDVVIATHNPLVGLGGLAGATLFQTKLALYTSYVIAGRVPRGVVADALWWDTGDPYHYLRVVPHRDFDLVIFGGEDHKTGQQDDTDACYRRLEERLGALVDRVELTHRWSGQVIETPDGLPYIGQNAEHQYAATGFGGNGLTFGTLAGIMISDAILERSNPWAELFDPGRKALKRGLWDYLTENVDYPYYMIRDRFAGAEARSLRAVKRGQGKIIERNGAKVAAYRDQAGAITLRSAICTHMGCAVAWNTAERTWDCPCHGSRFEPTGEVISGPAEKPLPEAE